MRFLSILTLVIALPMGAMAQDDQAQTLADIRLELGNLGAQIQGLKLELQTKGQAETGITDATPILQRIDLLEQELRRVTGSVEKTQFEIKRIVEDGTNRIGDLNFRVTELEGGNILKIGETPPLGTGESQSASVDGFKTVRPKLRPRNVAYQPPVPEVEPIPDVEVVETEQSMFDAALASYYAGDYRLASDKFSTFLTRFPQGPRTGEAAFWRGESLAAQGDWNLAARSYLDSFSGAPEGTKAPEALYRLGVSLGRLGQTREACLTLNEIGSRYPAMTVDLEQKTRAEMQALSCS